jgi:hypothetical protein
MGSSSKKKKEKQKDFQKAKLKVGKAKVKPANFTDTSFRSKGEKTKAIKYSYSKDISSSREIKKPFIFFTFFFFGGNQLLS